MSARVMRGKGGTDAEIAAHAVNDEPWQPLPGMVKRRCERCSYWFATPRRGMQARCPDCRGFGTRGGTVATS